MSTRGLSRRSFLQLSAGTAVATLLAACAPQEPAAPEEPAEEAAAEEEVVSEPAAAERAMVTWLTLTWDQVNPALEIFHDEVADVMVEPEPLAWNDFFEQVQVQLAAGTGKPDIFSVDVPMVWSYGWRGWLLPLDDFYTQEEKDDWFEASLRAATYEGQLIAPAVESSTQLLYYNKELFERGGVTPPGEDDRWTWEQIKEAGEKVTFDENGDGIPDIWGFIWEQMIRIYQLQPLPMSLGGKPIGDDNLTVRGVINDDHWIEAFTYYYNAFNEWQISQPGEQFVARESFMTQNLSMFVGGPWNIRRIIEGEIDFDWGVSRHPYFEGGEIYTPTGAWNIGVNSTTDERDASVTFVHWLTTAHGAGEWWKLMGNMAAHNSVLELFYEQAEFQGGKLAYFLTAADESTQNPEPRPLTVGYVEYSQILENSFQDIRNGADVKESLDTAVDRIEAEMEKYR
jgi:ABC-type glycerol-3-phosphate transport system substrate-binding protein